MEIRSAKKLQEVEDAYELAARIFGPNYFEAQATKARLGNLDPVLDLEDVVLLVEDNKIFGLVRIVDRQLNSTKGLVKVGGITGVCVHPRARGLGWGLKLMETALHRSQGREDVFSILFARRAVDGWYRTLGYLGIGGHLALTVEKFAGDGQPFSGKLLHGFVADWSKLYAQAYLESYAGLPLSFHRGFDWWQKFEQWAIGKITPENWITVVWDEEPVGYFAMHLGRVVEAAALNARQPQFVLGLLDLFTREKAQKILLALPLRHWCMSRLQRFDHTLSSRYSWDGGHMLRIVNLEAAINIFGQSNKVKDEKFSIETLTDHERIRQCLLQLVRGDLTSPLHCSESVFVSQSERLIDLPVWSVLDEL